MPTLRVLARTNDAPVVTLDAHGRNAHAVAFTCDGAYLLSGGDAASVRLWKTPGFRPAGELACDGRSVHAVRLSPDGRHAATASSDGAVRIWSFPERAVRHVIAGQASAAFSPDGARLATVGVGGFGVSLWDVASGARMADLRALDARVFSLAFSPDGLHLLIGGIGPVRRVRLRDLGEEASLSGHPRAVTSLCAAPNRRWLATVGAEGALRLWALPEWRLAHVIGVRGRGAMQIAFEPMSELIAVAREHHISLLRLEDGGEVDRIDVLVKGVHDLAFSPDGRYLACACADGRVRIWVTRLPKRGWRRGDDGRASGAVGA